jgi:hypothetical protein
MLSLLNTTFTNTLRQGFTLIGRLLSKLKARSTYFENQTCTKATLKEIDSAGLLEKASIITTPTAYSDGVLHSVKPEQTLGSELITNGDFATDSDWNLQTGWSISNDKLRGSNVSSQNAVQNQIFTQGVTYKITYTISDYGKGEVMARLVGGGGGGNLTVNSSNGTFTEYVVSNANHTSFRIRGENTDGGFTGSIENVSVKEVIDADFTFTRNNIGTRVNSSGNIESVGVDLPRINYEGFSYQDVLGSELITNGDFATDSDWNKGTGWSISNNTAISDGSTVSESIIAQIIQLVEGKTYQVILNVDSVDSGRVRFYSNFLGGGQADITSSGTFTYNVISSITGGRTVGIRARDTGTESVINSISVKEVLKQEVVPNSGCGSWLLEQQSQNLIDYSEDFSQNYFAFTSASVSSSTITDPTGNQNSFKLIPDNGTGGNRSIGRSFINLTGLHTFTCFAKKAEYNYLTLRTRNGPNTAVMFNLDNGTFNVNSTSAAFVSAEIDDYGNGWYRCSVTLDPSQMTNVGQIFVSLSVGIIGDETNSFSGDGVSGVYIFGMQFEEKSYQTSYIPTSGSPVTRAADSATDAGSSDLIGSTEGVFYAELKSIAEYTDASSISINNSTAQSRINIFKTSTNNKLLIQVRAQNNSVNFGYTSATTNVDFDKVAVKWKSGDYAIWINGVEVATSTSTILPIGLNRIDFNGYTTNFQPFQGNVKCVAVFQEALTDAELTALTS